MLAQELRRLGCSVAYDAKEEAIVLTAIPDEVSKAFSKGRTQIEGKAKASPNRRASTGTGSAPMPR